MTAKKQQLEKKLKITPSSGNVFADIGIANSTEHIAKVELVHQINKIISNLKQKDAAALLGIDQPKISALKKGIVSGFSIDRLLVFLNKLNQDIEIIIKPHSAQANTLPYIAVWLLANNASAAGSF